MHLSFFPRFLHLQPHIHLSQLNFSAFFFEKNSPTKPKYNNDSKRFALNRLKMGLCALMDDRNLRSALCYFTCMYSGLKLDIHSNQVKLPVASSVDYIISRMSLPFCKVLSSCTGTQNAKNIHLKCFPRVDFTSLALEKIESTYKL